MHDGDRTLKADNFQMIIKMLIHCAFTKKADAGSVRANTRPLAGVLSALQSEQPPSFHTVAEVAGEKRDTDTDRVV